MIGDGSEGGDCDEVICAGINQHVDIELADAKYIKAFIVTSMI